MKLWQRVKTATGIMLKGGAYSFDRPLDTNGGLAGPQLCRPFAESVYVMAAIQHIAKPISAVPLEFYTTGESETPVNDPQLSQLWERPAHRVGSLAEFVLGTVGWRKLAGESFWIMDDTSLVPFPEVRQTLPRLILARPDRMRHIEADGELTGWEFRDGKGRRHVLLIEQVVHLKQWNPYNEYRGLGNYETARLAAETEAANERFQLSLAQNNGDQGVYVVAKNGIPDDPQKAQIVAQIREKRALQQRGVFKPIFLAGDISIEDPKVRSVDAAFLEGSRVSGEKIFLAFGVPVSMASKTESYSIGAASDYFRLILDACQPEAREIAAGISQVSERLTGRELEACFDWDVHPVLQAVRRESLDSLGKLCDRGMPVKDAGEYLNLGLPRFTGDDVGHLPFSVAPVGEEFAPEKEPATQEPPATDPVQEALRVLSLKRAQPVCAKVGKGSAKDAAAWRAHMRLRAATVRSYEKAFSRVLFDARAEVLRKLDAFAKATGTKGATDIKERAGAYDLLFDLDKFKSSLKAAFRGAGQNALQSAGEQLFEELGKSDPFVYPPAKAIEFLQQRENHLSEIADDVHDQINAVIQDGLNAGDSISAISGMVRGEFNELSRSRANTIAMTETAAAYGTARQAGMEQAGVQYKQWLTSGADNVREAHRLANGQTVAADASFVVGGEELRFPGDPHGSPSNIINCHCVAVAVAAPEEAS